MIQPIAPDLQEMIEQEMKVRGYSDQNELLRDAIDAFRQCQRWDINEEVVAGIERGLADVAAGRVTSLAEFDKQFRDKNGILPKSSP